MYFFTGSILDGVSEMFLSGLSEFHWIPPDWGTAYFEKARYPAQLEVRMGWLPAKIGIFMLPHSVQGPEAGKMYWLKAVMFLLVSTEYKICRGGLVMLCMSKPDDM